MTTTGRLSLLGVRAMAIAFVMAAIPGEAPAADTAKTNPTFAKDVAPILQQKCQVCHRPGTIAPMSLLTYEDVRPWARSIKLRVALREMPPWSIDKTQGIQKYKNDRSLTDDQIATIVKWVDTGAPGGDPKDLPAPVTFQSDDEWAIGKPDLVVSTAEIPVYAKGPDWWPSVKVPTGLTEDRFIKAVETKPSREGRFVTHHASVSVTQEEDPFTASAVSSSAVPGTNRATTQISEFVTGKYGDIFSDGSGRLLKAGSDLTFSMHFHAIGEETRSVVNVGFVFYPKGYVPKYQSRWITMFPGDYNDLEIPPHSVARSDSYFRLPKPTRLDGFQPHMHIRGKAQCLEAIYPNVVSSTPAVNTRGGGQREVLACVDRFDFNWQVAYVFADDVAPLLPEGTILHTISIFDNTANNKYNPDPTRWVGYGQRSIDEMANAHLTAVFLDDEDYARMVAERKAKNSQQQTTQQQ